MTETRTEQARMVAHHGHWLTPDAFTLLGVDGHDLMASWRRLEMACMQDGWITIESAMGSVRSLAMTYGHKLATADEAVLAKIAGGSAPVDRRSMIGPGSAYGDCVRRSLDRIVVTRGGRPIGSKAKDFTVWVTESILPEIEWALAFGLDHRPGPEADDEHEVEDHDVDDLSGFLALSLRAEHSARCPNAPSPGVMGKNIGCCHER